MEQAALKARAHLWKSREREWRLEGESTGEDLMAPVVYCCCGIDLVEDILAEKGARKVHVLKEVDAGKDTSPHGLLHRFSSFWKARHG